MKANEIKCVEHRWNEHLTMGGSWRGVDMFFRSGTYRKERRTCSRCKRTFTNTTFTLDKSIAELNKDNQKTAES